MYIYFDKFSTNWSKCEHHYQQQYVLSKTAKAVRSKEKNKRFALQQIIYSEQNLWKENMKRIKNHWALQKILSWLLHLPNFTSIPLWLLSSSIELWIWIPGINCLYSPSVVKKFLQSLCRMKLRGEGELRSWNLRAVEV